MEEKVPIFDGHNDYLSRAWSDDTVDFLSGEKTLHISLEAMRAGGIFGGLFAIFVPPRRGDGGQNSPPATGGAHLLPEGLPPAIDIAYARRSVTEQFAILTRLVERSGGALTLATTVAEIERARAAGQIAAVAHMEGAEAISRSLDELELFRSAGVRSLGIVWSRPNRFGRGVPIYGEGTPDAGPGLTDAGKRLVRRVRDLGMVLDLSHITERGFWDVAAADGMPLVASHSNAWELCRSPRNLTDRQLDAIGRSDGFVGLNFGTIFLRQDRALNSDTPLTVMIDHLRYLIDRVGVERVGFGSDFDGTMIAGAIGDAGGAQHLIAAMRESGFSREDIEKIAWRNWIDLLRRVWG